ncbi:MAG: hypothetical protein ACRCX2_03435 [Paraclostridium sp.]
MDSFKQCTTKEMSKSAIQLLNMMVVGHCSVEELFKKEDKMEKVEMKVRYIENFTNVKLTKYKIYDVLTECEEYFTVINDNGESQKYAKHYFLIVNNDETNKVMLVRKLEDFTFLKSENYEIRVDENKKHIIVVDKKGMIICEINVKYSEMLKQLGFCFNYKPLDKNEEKLEKILESVEDVKAKNNIRNIFKIQKEFFEEIRNKMLSDVKRPSKVVHEVIQEIKSLDSLTFKQGEFNYFVSWCKGKYHVEAMRETFIIGVNYMTKEQAQKYAEELNEIIGVGK